MEASPAATESPAPSSGLKAPTGKSVSSTKYACASCIKGHRVSGCRHTERELYPIRPGPKYSLARRLENRVSQQPGQSELRKKYKKVESSGFEIGQISTSAILQDLWVYGATTEPSVQSRRQVRLVWQCKCREGVLFSDEVTELRKDGVAELVKHMERSSGAVVHSTGHSQNPHDEGHIYARTRLLFQKAVSKITGLFQRDSPVYSLPQHNSSIPVSTPQATGNISSQQQALHVMTCMREGGHRKCLRQDRVESVNSDRELLIFLRSQFTGNRGRLKSLLSMKTVKGIFFVKFRLPLGGSVEVRDHDPCCTPTSCECIPPASKVEPSPGAEYRCRPGPPATYPPICPTYLMHLFESPSCVDETDTWILDLLPKRVCGELRGTAGDPAEGWGIYYREGWDQDLITLVVFVLFFSASLLFGVLWSTLRMDVQGAFGVSAYVTAACGILIAMVSMRADKG
ncbi:hypothetical protein BDV95DRAFT_580891 [Massariosphaeria phaeospora]|uniref:Copper-fist domain-containing protein n=1 Tax=Massariosphaeria phaeospora TaxID=100035 RepID=A0A7C8I5Q6_9PLEO|nr:hypothetical protein BDV95DRAFT_580891 [Massariosphaeria phaeospora]